MAVNPRSYDDIYNLLKATIQSPSRPNIDFTEGSYFDIMSGAFSLGYQELQRLVLDRFAKTQLQNAQTRGETLENLAIDQYHDGIARPRLTRSVGAVTVTRIAGNTGAIAIALTDEFTADGQKFKPMSAVTIASTSNDSVVLLRAEVGGPAGNVKAGVSWTTTNAKVTAVATSDFQGGANPLSDGDYRIFIKNFIENLQDGTKQGLEGAAKIVPGVADARLVKKLVSVGTLTSTGALETTPTKFNTIINTLYVAGTNGQANEAILELVKRNVNSQLSAGELISFSTATPRVIDWSVDLTFSNSNDAIALSKKRVELQTAFDKAINDLAIGTNFVRTAMATKVLDDNNWRALFTVKTNTPAGDITVGANEKPVAGNVIIEVS